MYSIVVAVFCIVTLWLSSVEAVAPAVGAQFSGGSRTLLRSIGEDQIEKHDYAVELNASNFDVVLKEATAIWAVVEFYAHWCPACRNYKPQYEKVARLFNGGDAAHPGIILMARVDCALKINSNICEKFSVGHYPMLLWGPPSKFTYRSWDPKRNPNGIQSIDDGRTAERLLNWINKETNSSYGFDDKKYEHGHLYINSSDPGQIARSIYDVEEATHTAFDIILQHKMIKPETKTSLLKFLQLLVVHHPSRRCRKGTADILIDFDSFSANENENTSLNDNYAFGKYQVCGKDLPRGYWIACRGSKKDTRGFSCGLWILLHSLSVRVDDGETHEAFTTICDFIHNFFICQECRQHFYDMCSSVNTPFTRARDLVLWFWNAHNKVNKRLMKEELSLGTYDPRFPKTIWPSRQLCPSCYLSKNEDDNGEQIDWNHNEVYEFLTAYYGEALLHLSKDKENIIDQGTDPVAAEEFLASPNAVVVPVGAALAIALASCAFGALAFYWRQQQKNRKPWRSRN